MTLHVTPEVLLDTQNAIINALEQATQITKSYVTEQENMNAAGIWQGDGVTASTMTAGQLSEDLMKTILGGNRLAEGLGGAAVLVGDQEDDATQNFNAVFGSSPIVNPA